MSVYSDAELTALNSSRLPDNTVRYISAKRARDQIQDVIDSKVNVADVKGILTNPITEQYWKTNMPNPTDGLYHIIKITRGVDGIEQQEDMGPV